MKAAELAAQILKSSKTSKFKVPSELFSVLNLKSNLPYAKRTLLQSSSASTPQANFLPLPQLELNFNSWAHPSLPLELCDSYHATLSASLSFMSVRVSIWLVGPFLFSHQINSFTNHQKISIKIARLFYMLHNCFVS